MLNILLPAMGNSMFFKDYLFPKLMCEVKGETILEKVIHNYCSIEDKKYIVMLSDKECNEFHLDKSVKLLTGKNGKVFTINNQTKGALCTCLLAIEMINNDIPLVIANCDQILDVNYNDIINYFCDNNYDAGVITFPSVHPRWSYVRIDNSAVVEVAEKRPLSHQAVAGFYYFRKGRDFIECAQKVILKDGSVNGTYYVSSSLNEMILMGKTVGFYEIGKEQYHSFYSPEKIREYEMGEK